MQNSPLFNSTPMIANMKNSNSKLQFNSNNNCTIYSENDFNQSEYNNSTIFLNNQDLEQVNFFLIGKYLYIYILS